MRNILKSINNNKKIIIGVILAPIVMYILNIYIISIFNIGTYVGTFIRNLFNYVC